MLLYFGAEFLITAFAAAAMLTARRVSRPEGAVLLTGYVVFLVVLIGQAP